MTVLCKSVPGIFADPGLEGDATAASPGAQAELRPGTPGSRLLVVLTLAQGHILADVHGLSPLTSRSVTDILKEHVPQTINVP